MAAHQEINVLERNSGKMAENCFRPAHLHGQGKRVHLAFFGLNESPFSITPDPQFLFLSTTHQITIDKILYGIDSQMGFILLTGEVGTGKTTVCRSILDNLRGGVETVYIINPSFSGKEIISSILDDLGVSYPIDSTKKDILHRLNTFLLSENNFPSIVIIIDDAQTMSLEALEDLRLLSNLETDKEKLIQIVLVGQPELLDLLSDDRLRQLKQRVAISCRLDFLKEEEVEGYITRRLFIAGDRGRVRFTRKAIRLVHKHSNGVPRIINKICDYALTAGYVSNDFIIRPEHIRAALNELDHYDSPVGRPFHQIKKWWRRFLYFFGIFSIIIGLLIFIADKHGDVFSSIKKRVGIESYISTWGPEKLSSTVVRE